MTHAFVSPDPIHAAIKRHRAACDAYHLAPSLITNDDMDAATDALVATVCTSRFGALSLLDHLRQWLTEEAEFAAGHQPSYRIAFARAADLTLFLGRAIPPTVLPRAMPSGRLGMPVSARPLPAVDRQHRVATIAPRDEPQPGAIEPWEAVTPVRPDTAHSRSLRFLDTAGELLAAVAIVGGGMVLTGLSTLL